MSMSNTRRRSNAWIKGLVGAPWQVAPVEEQELYRTSGLVVDRIRNVDLGAAENNGNGQEEPEEDLDNPDQAREKQYLEQYFRFLHCIGLSSFKEYWKNTITASYLIHKGLFFILSTFGILDALKMVKLCSIFFATKGDMQRYVMIGRFGLNFAKRFYFAILLTSRSKQILKVFKELDALKAGKGKHKTNCLANLWTFGFGLLSPVAAIIGVTFGWVTIGEEWSLSDWISSQGIEMNLSLFLWTSNVTTVNEQYTTLEESYERELSPLMLSLAILGILMESLGLLSDYGISDIMFYSAITMYKLGKEFHCQMMLNSSNVEEMLSWYKQLQHVSNCIDEAFGGLFKITHASNLLTCANILAIAVLDTEYHVETILMGLQILKVWTTYYLAIKSANVNKSFRRWIRNAITNSNTMDVDMKLKASAVLDESLESPLGIGSDTFFIDEIFVLKFATMVGTFALFLIDTKRNSEMG